MPDKYILGIDQGTTRTKAIIFDNRGRQIASGIKEVLKVFPKPGWVEQDPMAIWRSILESIEEAVSNSNVNPADIAAIGIADQGETVIVWDSERGRPLYNAIVWQCRRTSQVCEKLKADGWEDDIKSRTGLVVDPYFSATKVKWILDNVKGSRKMAEEGRALFGTTDTWLIWNLTGGRCFVTDFATASRTMMFNIGTLRWDEKILDLLDIPEEMLPSVVPNSGIVAYTKPEIFHNLEVPIAGVIVDQQGALFGHNCFEVGSIKNSYGTGCFALMNTGEKPKFSKKGLLTTIAWVLDGKPTYAIDGGVYVAGAAVQWLKDGLGIISDPSETEDMALKIEDNGGVYFVPAFVGLAAPYWDTYARGTIIGITEGTRKEHIVRAALEAIAYQSYEVIECMRADSELEINALKVDGGPTANKFLMQFQSDLLGIPVMVPVISETTSLGAAYLAGLAVDIWKDVDELAGLNPPAVVYYPKMREKHREKLLSNWRRAVRRAQEWEEH
jgi:glycerol kinase